MKERQYDDNLVQIDENHLDRECKKLPEQYLACARMAAEARFDLDESKAAFEVAEAEVKQHIRNAPGTYGIEKTSNDVVNEVCILQPKYKKALDAFNKAKHELAMSEAVVSALEHKKRSLTLLVELHGTSYFSEVRTSVEGRKAVQDMSTGRMNKPLKKIKQREDKEE